MCIFSSVAGGVGDVAGLRIPGMLFMVCFFVACFLLTKGLFLRDARFRLTFAFAFSVLMPGILCPSCWETTFWLIENDKISVADKIKCLYCENILFMIPTSLDGAGVSRKETRKRPRPFTPG